MPPIQQQPPPTVPPPQFAPDDLMLVYDRIIRDLEQHLQLVAMLPSNPLTSHLHSLLDAAVQARNTREPRAAITLLQKVNFCSFHLISDKFFCNTLIVFDSYQYIWVLL